MTERTSDQVEIYNSQNFGRNMKLNEIDVTPVYFTFLDERLLIAQVGGEVHSQRVSDDFSDRVEHIVSHLITVIELDDSNDQVVATITDSKGVQIQNFKFSCASLSLSPNFFNCGYWLEIEFKSGNKKKRCLLFDYYKDQIFDPEEVRH